MGDGKAQYSTAMSRFGTLPFDRNGLSASWFHLQSGAAKKNAKEKGGFKCKED
jgi:hypothetical protein